MSEIEVTEDDALAASRIWWLFAIVGAASLIAGVILVLKPSDSLKTLAVIFGIFLLIDGIAALIQSVLNRVESRALSAIIGVLSVVVGIALIRHPLHGVAAIGILIGIWLVVAGVVGLVRAIAEGPHRLLRGLLAVLEIVAGIVIVANPHIGYGTLAILAGIWLILNGIGSIALGVALHGVTPAQGTGSGRSR